MLVIVLGLLACAAAAPQYYGQHHHQRHPWNHYPPPPPNDYLGDYFSPQYHFDTPRFWSQLSRELMEMDRILEEFYKRFPSNVNNEGLVNNEYVITIDLPGFDEKNIVVKGKDNILMIQAIQKPEDDGKQSLSEKYYMDIRTLPSYVKATGTGTWTYSENVLKIVFPVKDVPTTTETSVEVMTTESPAEEHSREEMDVVKTTEDEQVGNADIGVDNPRGDRDHKQTEIETNEIPTNEVIKTTEVVTTYPVDFNNDIDFVRVQ